MTYREKLQLWVREALGELGGQGFIVDVTKRVWAAHENEIKQANDAFFTWQYDLRWAANQLRRAGNLDFHKDGARSVWILKK